MRAGRIVLVGLLFVSTAAAQQKVINPASPESSRPQSANQIVGFSEQKPAGQTQTQDTVKKNEDVRPPAVVITLKATVIPPPPNVVKSSVQTISIPADKANADSKYEEKPTVASQATVGSVFGVRRDPFTGRARFHAGVDIKARMGDPVGASQRGVVEFAGWYFGYGYMIIVHHGGGVRTHYAHLSSFDVQVGARVERGTILGRAGSTGRATSPHLHYEVRVDGVALNPFQPLALDASSDYFKQTQPPEVATGHDPSTEATRPRRVTN
jgi:murein DD-endopeptidase MepM/ murein hydrolase activator NlpD